MSRHLPTRIVVLKNNALRKHNNAVLYILLTTVNDTYKKIIGKHIFSPLYVWNFTNYSQRPTTIGLRAKLSVPSSDFNHG